MAALMIQGCGSDVGKSLLVAGLCRLFTNQGLAVRPFKLQNMSNNAAVAADGGEIGRSTALQALACRTTPSVHMNPILLKPQSDLGAQLVVRGRRAGVVEASAHRHSKQALLQVAVRSYRHLQRDAQLMIVEGAGSPAETNLREHDIANMGFAQAVGLPVVLVGDIDRGHVIAALAGAHTVLDAADRARIHGFIVNKFRGDADLFQDGLRRIEALTGWPSLGLVPWLPAAGALPAEDAMQLDQGAGRGGAKADTRTKKIAVLRLPHIANFDDFDPLRHEPGVEVAFVPPGRPLPRDADLIILPGSKTSIADLNFLRAQGWDIDLHAHVHQGGRVLGICAGYQMLGRQLHDPQGIEGTPMAVPGLNLLDVSTTMTPVKQLRSARGVELTTGARISGYEMHLGVSSGPATARPMIRFDSGAVDGAVSEDGRIAGCHVHGLFDDSGFRSALLAALGARSSGEDHARRIDRSLDDIAAALAAALNVDALLRIAALHGH